MRIERCRSIDGSIENGDLLGVVWGCWATSFPSFIWRVILISDIMFNPYISSRRRKITWTSVYFHTDLVTGARPARHEGAMILTLCGSVAQVERTSVSRLSILHQMRALDPYRSGHLRAVTIIAKR